MLIPLLLGSIIIVVNMGIQVLAVVVLIQYITTRIADGRLQGGLSSDVKVLSIVLGVLFAGHLLQFACWALVFILVGEFSDFHTAFYHSTVNFSSLGYGDIVMSENWRILGALEAANGVMMFGLSAGTILSVMTRIFSNHREKAQQNLAESVGKD